MKKKLISLMLVGAMAFSMTACGLSKAEEPAAETPAAEEPKAEEPAAEEPAAEEPAAEEAADSEYPAANDPAVTLVMAEVNPLDTIVGQMDSKFKEEVERLSGGSVTIDLQASGVLGSENDVLDAMLGGAGTIQMSRISAFALTSYGGKKSSLLSIPYTWQSRDHWWAFAESDLAQEFLQEPSENGSGIRGLFYGEEGFRHFFSSKELTDISSLQGLKIRVSNDPIMNGMVEGLGASPTVVDFGELYSALQTGVVDAAEQPIANYKSNAFPEVANNLILDGHTLGAVQVVITDDAWNSLTPAQQDAMTEAGKLASAHCKAISAEAEAEVLESLKADGCNVVEVEDITPWQDACKKVIEENTADQADLYQQLLDFAK